MRISKLVLAASLSAGLFASAGFATAQDQQGGGGQGGGMGNPCMREVMQSLGLTDAQKDQLKAIRESSQTPEEKRAARDKVLTPAQQQTMQAGREKCRAQQGH